MPRTLVIVNLRSGRVTSRRWRALEHKLREALGPLDVEFTRGPRDAERIAREGVRAGIERIVAAGGDGTLSEVASGLLSAELGGYAAIGILPLGTGSDFSRTLGEPRQLDRIVERLAEGKTREIDAGRVSFRDTRGRPATSYFANVASLGLSGLVDELVNRNARSKLLGGRVSFLIATLRALARHRGEPAALWLDGEPVFEGPLVLAAVANGQFFGGGMWIAPSARPDDGLLDLIVVPDSRKLRLLGRLPRLYRGSHVELPDTLVCRGRVVEARCGANVRVPLDVDGEALGSLPARFEILPNAISLFGWGA